MRHLLSACSRRSSAVLIGNLAEASRAPLVLVLALSVGCKGAPPPESTPPAGGVCKPTELSARDGDGPAGLLGDPSLRTVPIEAAITALGPDGAHREAEVSLGDRQLLVAEFEVRALDDPWGSPWKVPVIVLAPMPGELRNGHAAILSTNLGSSQAVRRNGEDPVWGTDHPAWFLGGGRNRNRGELGPWFAGDEFAQTFAYNFVLQTGMPVVITSVVPKSIDLGASPVGEVLNQAMGANDEPCDDAFCDGPLDAHHLTNCLLRAALLEGDMTYDPYLRYAITAMRVLDGAEHVLNELYAARESQDRVALERVFGVGCSKYGHVLRTLAAVEPRIAGVLVGCADLSNLPAFFAQQDRLWEGSFSFTGTREIYEAASESVVARWTSTFDQSAWKPSVLDGTAMIVAAGTRDQLYPLPSSYTYSESMPANHSYLFVPNFGHGIGSVDHVAALRSMVTRTLAGDTLLRVEAQWFDESDQVVGRLDGGVAVSAELWCSTRMVPSEATVPNVCGDRPPLTPTLGTDMRHAGFEKTDMRDAGDGRWEGTVPETEYDAPACLVRMRTAADDVVTSQPLLSTELCRRAGLAD